METYRRDRSAPVLLWLYRGPGGQERRDLEQDFVACYWDQRGAGRSFDSHGDPRVLTIDRHVSDLDVVVDYLRRA